MKGTIRIKILKEVRPERDLYVVCIIMRTSVGVGNAFQRCGSATTPLEYCHTFGMHYPLLIHHSQLMFSFSLFHFRALVADPLMASQKRIGYKCSKMKQTEYQRSQKMAATCCYTFSPHTRETPDQWGRNRGGFSPPKLKIGGLSPPI